MAKGSGRRSHQNPDLRVQNTTECQCFGHALCSGLKCDCHELIVPDLIACCCGWFTLRVGSLLLASSDFIWFGAIFMRAFARMFMADEYVGQPSHIEIANAPINLTDEQILLWIGIPSLILAILSMVGVYGVFHRSIFSARVYAVTTLILFIATWFSPIIFYKDKPNSTFWWCLFTFCFLYSWWRFVVVYNLVNSWLHGRSGDERNKNSFKDTANFTHPCINKYSCIILVVYLFFFISLIVWEFRNGRYHKGEVIE